MIAIGDIQVEQIRITRREQQPLGGSRRASFTGQRPTHKRKGNIVTEHAIQRISERIPGIDPGIVYEFLKVSVDSPSSVPVHQTVTGELVYEVVTLTGEIAYPVMRDGFMITVLAHGMEITTPTGRVTLERAAAPQVEHPASDFDIRTLEDGELITEPGFYQIPIDQHHSQPCDGPSVTSGVLRRIELSSPAEVWAHHQLNPNRIPQKDTDALRLGRVMAAYIESGPEALKDYVLLLPGASEPYTVSEMIAMAEAGESPGKGRPNRPNFGQVEKWVNGDPTPAGKKSVEFWKAVEDDHRIPVTKEEWNKLCAMGDALKADPMSSAALGGVPEITMAWFDDATGLWCLARPDQVDFSGMTSDYKKMAPSGMTFNGPFVDRKITQFGYLEQMSFACEGFNELTGVWPDAVGIVAQSDVAPHPCILRSFEEEDLRIGMARNQRARRTFRECLDSGNWWGPGEHVGNYHMPDWLRERLQTELSL